MATSTNQIDFTLNANTKDFEANISNSVKAVENLSNNNDTLSESLEDVSKFMKEAAKVNTNLTKAIKDLAKAFDDSVDSTNKEAKALDNVSKEAKESTKELKKFSEAAKGIEKNSKAGNIALEAIKDNLGSIPVLGPTATRALDGLEGSFSKLVLAGAGVGAVTGAIAGLGATIYGAYTQSEKFRDSIEDFKNNAAIAFSPMLNTLEKIGDAFSNIVNNMSEAMEYNNAVNGNILTAQQRTFEEIKKEYDSLNEKREDSIKALELETLTTEEKKKRLLEIEKEYNDSIVELSKKSMPSLNAELEKQKKQLEEATIKYQEAEKAWEPLKNSFEDGSLVFTNAKNNFEDSKSAVDNLSTSISNLESFMSELSTTSKEASKTSKDLNNQTKNQISEYEKLTQSLAAVVDVRNAEARIIEDNYTGKEKEIEAVKSNINALEQQKQLITNYYIEAKKQGKDYYDESLKGIIAQVNGNEEVTGSVEDLGKALQKINQLLAEQKKQYEELNKPLVDLKAAASQIMSSIQSAYNSIGSAVMSIKSMDLIDTSKFDEQINIIQGKLDEFDEEQKKKEEEKQELSDEEYENYLARLDEEYQKAVEANDLMSQEAIRIKKEELESKREQEKKELEEEKKANKEREELERQLAEAQYNKDYAEWQNQVKLAELQKNKAIADAIILPALATAQAALGLATSFAQGGPVGFAAGVALSATAIGSAVGAAAGVASAASALDNVKSNPPEMPRFEFGTTGYYLGYEETALVGERGPELVKNMGGILQVQSAAQTEAMGNGGGEKIGMYIENLTFQVSQRLTADEIYEFMTSFKARNLRFRR
ncbi:hypothetical protein [Brachyspira hyodysenteriae]|uniref:hypothetical protein n=1 Tax=Brachyspira hyodysenteriae TaxID=159 RepID=UPI00069C8BAD|nr:hypothetical protein [Brachyspira hyodysenteriae]